LCKYSNNYFFFTLFLLKMPSFLIFPELWYEINIKSNPDTHEILDIIDELSSKYSKDDKNIRNAIKLHMIEDIQSIYGRKWIKNDFEYILFGTLTIDSFNNITDIPIRIAKKFVKKSKDILFVYQKTILTFDLEMFIHKYDNNIKKQVIKQTIEKIKFMAYNRVNSDIMSDLEYKMFYDMFESMLYYYENNKTHSEYIEKIRIKRDKDWFLK